MFVPSAQGPDITPVGRLEIGKERFRCNVKGFGENVGQGVGAPPTTSEGSNACVVSVKKAVRHRVSQIQRGVQAYRASLFGPLCVSTKSDLLSWNLANTSEGEFEVLLKELDAFRAWDVCALQELGAWSAGRHWYFTIGVLIAGSHFRGSHPVGLLIKPNWYQRFVCNIDHPRHVTIQLRACTGRNFTCTSVHLPGAHNATSEFEEVLESVRAVWDELHYALVGIDANAQLGLRESTDCPWSIGVCGLPGRDDR